MTTVKILKVHSPWKSNQQQDNPTDEIDILEDDELSREELESLYYELMPEIVQLKLQNGMTHDLARALTDRLMGSLFHLIEWKDIAGRLDYVDQSKINQIEFNATKLNHAHPFYYFLMKTLAVSDGTWANLVQVFLQEERYDLLSELKPFIEDIIGKFFPSQRHERTFSGESAYSSISQISSIEDNSRVPVELQCSRDYLELNNFNVTQLNELTQTATPIVNVTENGTIPSLAKFFETDIVSNKVSVFITHTEQDFELATQIGVRLRQAGFIAFVQGEEESMFAIDEFLTVQKIYRKIDFLVPLVTNVYLQQILDSPDMDGSRLMVRYIFITYQGQFVDSQGKHLSIKPLTIKGMTNHRIYPELRLAMRIWQQFDKFCDILNKTKVIKDNWKSNTFKM